MTERRRRYTKSEKVAAIVAAEASSAMAAAEQTGVPRSTLRYWLDDPEFAVYRQNAREAMAEEASTVARLAWAALANAIRAGELDGRDLRAEHALDHVPRGAVATVEVDRADQRLEHVGEDLGFVAAAALLLALAEQDPVPDLDLARDLAQRGLADDLLARDAEIALVRGRKPRHQPVADHEIEDGISEEFEALVVIGAWLGLLVAPGGVPEGRDRKSVV